MSVFYFLFIIIALFRPILYMKYSIKVQVKSFLSLLYRVYVFLSKGVKPPHTPSRGIDNGGHGGRLPPRTPKIGKESKNREEEKGGKERKKRERKRKEKGEGRKERKRKGKGKGKGEEKEKKERKGKEKRRKGKREEKGKRKRGKKGKRKERKCWTGYVRERKREGEGR